MNGKDVSEATHEETLDALNTSTEPIQVQVLRKNGNFEAMNNNYNSILTLKNSGNCRSSTVQTDVTLVGIKDVGQHAGSTSTSTLTNLPDQAELTSFQNFVMMNHGPAADLSEEEILIPGLDYEVSLNYITKTHLSNKLDFYCVVVVVREYSVSRW